MSRVLEKLYLGGYMEARNFQKLKRWGITHIAAVAAEAVPCFPGSFSYLHIKAIDYPSFRLSPYFDQVADFINNAIESENGIVYVHCQMGISRSATCVIAYLMKYHDMTYDKARMFVASKRSIIYPNPGFQRQLMRYEKTLNARKTGKGLIENISELTNSKLSLTKSNKFEEEKQPLGSLTIRPLKTKNPAEVSGRENKLSKVFSKAPIKKSGLLPEVKIKKTWD